MKCEFNQIQISSFFSRQHYPWTNIICKAIPQLVRKDIYLSESAARPWKINLVDIAWTIRVVHQTTTWYEII